MFNRLFMESKEKYDAVDFSPHAKLPLFDKHMNAMGTSFGTMIPFNIFGYFLLYYYTDAVGLSPALAGTLIMFARVFDVFTDIMIGYFIDKFNPRAGKYRFWVLLSILPQFIVFILVFTFVPSAPMPLTIVFCWITYGCYGALCATLGYIPQNCQTINMTTNPQERASAASLKGLYENIAILLVAACFLPVVNFFAGPSHNLSRGYTLTALVFAIISFAPVVTTCRTTRKYELNYDGTYRPQLLVQAQKEKLPLKTQLAYVIQNRPAMVTTLGVIIMFILQTVRNGMTVYLFDYYFQMPEMTSISLFFNCGLAMLGALAVPYLIKIFKDTTRAFIFAALSHSIMYVILYFWVHSSTFEAAQASMHFGPMFFFYAVCGLFQGMYYVFPQALMPSAVDYGIWKTGRNQAGLINSLYGCFLTLGGALGSFVNGMLLTSTGYVPGTAQSTATLYGMLFVGILLPACLSIAHGVLQLFAGISDKKHDQWIEEINERNAETLRQ